MSLRAAGAWVLGLASLCAQAQEPLPSAVVNRSALDRELAAIVGLPSGTTRADAAQALPLRVTMGREGGTFTLRAENATGTPGDLLVERGSFVVVGSLSPLSERLLGSRESARSIARRNWKLASGLPPMTARG